MFRPSRSSYFVRLLLLLPVALLTATIAGAGDASSAGSAPISLELLLSNLDTPVNLTSSGMPGDGRLFIVQQEGLIRVASSNGSLLAKPFLDLTDKVDDTNFASGLFGLAFHPNYATNGYFYVYYIHRQGDTRYHRLSRFKVSSNANVADPASENILLTVAKGVNEIGHNAGDLHFGPDGYLYFPLGDGDNKNLSNRPQVLTSLFGKMMRLNVDKSTEQGAADCKGLGSGDYSIPPDNPYAGSTEACDEIWASGLRNPWRFSFDRQTGDLYLSDIGQDEWDELNFLSNGKDGGQNYGWPCYEGNMPLDEDQWPNRGCSPNATYTFPIIALPIGSPQGDCSITGGFVYRGSRYQNLFGRYIMSDYCSGLIRAVMHNGNKWSITTYNNVSVPGGAISFGQGNDGELYVLNRQMGTVYRLIGQEASITSTPSVTPSETAVATLSPVPTTTPSPSATPNGTAVATPSATPTTTPLYPERYYLPTVLDLVTGGIPPIP